MKKMKKAMALLLAMVMTLAMGVTAFAGAPGTEPAETNGPRTITIENPSPGHTYTAYQILSSAGGVKNGQLTELNWGDGFSEEGKAALKTKLGLLDNATVAQVAVELAKIQNNSASMDEVAQILGDYKTGTGTPLSVDETTKVASVTVAQGYYLIFDEITDADAAGTEYATVSKYMVQVVGDVSIETKARATTTQKTVEDAISKKAEFEEANIGEAKSFYLVATLPDDYSAYKAFYMEFQDTMNHMDYVELTKVSVKRGVRKGTDGRNDLLDPNTGDEIAEIKAQNNSGVIMGYEATEPTAIEDGIVTDTAVNTLKVKILDLKQVVSGAQAGDCVIVEYKAKLNKSAVMNAANENKFKLVFSNNPNSEVTPERPYENPNVPTGESPEKQADLYTTEIELTKQDGTTHDILKGAGFTLTGTSNNVVISIQTTFEESEEGTYWKLKDGTYTTEDPAGFTTETVTALYDDITKKYVAKVSTTSETILAGPTNVTAIVGEDGKVKFSGLGVGEYKIEETTVPAGYNKMEDITFNITFENKTFKGSGILSNLSATIDNFSGSTLPSTGGIGTTIFYIVGAVLVIGAAILLVTKKRMSKEA